MRAADTAAPAKTKGSARMIEKTRKRTAVVATLSTRSGTTRSSAYARGTATAVSNARSESAPGSRSGA